MIVKVSIQFLNKAREANLVSIIQGVLTNLEGNLHFPNLDPALPVIAAALTDYQTAIAEGLNGGTDRTLAKKHKRAVLVGLVRELAYQVQKECQGDLGILLSSGFPTHKPVRERAGILAAPVAVRLTLGERSGDLEASTPPVAGAVTYDWIISAVANPDVPVQTKRSTAAYTTFSGLTPGVLYQVVVCLIGTRGPSDWSDAAMQMAV